ncbi:MAG: creatininase family protein [Dissulfuribacterales bacterium]
MIVEEMTMPAFEAGLKQTRSAILPVGSVEEHGGHLPLGTDTIHVYELAKTTVSLRPVFVLPPLWYGLCRSTSQHAGTVGVTGLNLRAFVLDIISSLYAQGIRNLVLISGHAGGTHMAFLVDAGEEAISRFLDMKIAVLSILDLLKDCPSGLIETRGDSHAGEVETALMLKLRPEHVTGSSPMEFPSFPPFILSRNKRRFWPNGVWGDPFKATLQKGEDILRYEAEKLADLLNIMEEFND